MPLLHADQLAPQPAANGAQIPLVDRFTVATLPDPRTKGVNKVCFVTDGTAAPGTTGVAPVGGGTFLNACWNNGVAWIVI